MTCGEMGRALSNVALEQAGLWIVGGWVDKFSEQMHGRKNKCLEGKRVGEGISAD